MIKIKNCTTEPIMLGRQCQIITIKVTHREQKQTLKPQSNNYYKFIKLEAMEDDGREHIKNIMYGPDIQEEVLVTMKRAHSDMSMVFNESLDRGYNHYYGKHKCKSYQHMKLIQQETQTQERN